MILRAPKVAAVAGVLAVSLSACVSLLPKTKPAQLYRFGVTPAAAAAAPTGAVGLYHLNGQFQREAAGDRILTVTGARAAYIADVRWIAPAEVLFDEAVANAFEAAPGPTRLVSRGEPVRSPYALRLDVRNFETDYAEGGPPTVFVRVRAVITKDQTRTPVAEQVFEARAPATQNRVGAIVAGYDAALAKVLGDIVGWTNSALGATVAAS